MLSRGALALCGTLLLGCGEAPTGDDQPIAVPGSFTVELDASSAPASGLLLLVEGVAAAPDLGNPAGSSRAVLLAPGEYRVLVTDIDPVTPFMTLTVEDVAEPPAVVVVQAAGSASTGYRQYPASEVGLRVVPE